MDNGTAWAGRVAARRAPGSPAGSPTTKAASRRSAPPRHSHRQRHGLRHPRHGAERSLRTATAIE